MAIYTCDACLFTFERKEEPISCPDCGKERLREATDLETETFEANRASTASEDA